MSFYSENQPSFLPGKRHIVFINGELTNGRRIADSIRNDDLLIGVDGGTNHILALGLTPHVVLGDLDSISKETLQVIQEKNIKTLRHPVDKDQTDLELAIEFSLSLAPTEIVFVSALGGRFDHALANILILNRADLHGRSISFFDGSTRIVLLSGNVEMRFEGIKGRTFSLLPISSDVRVEALQGARWGLANEALPLGTSRGVSNVFAEDTISIRLSSGRLLLVMP
jgi:thiamine pyrophosphokinase